MNHSCHRILLVETDTGIIDQVFELSEQVDAFRLQILLAADTERLSDMLDHYDFSLLVVNRQQIRD